MSSGGPNEDYPLEGVAPRLFSPGGRGATVDLVGYYYVERLFSTDPPRIQLAASRHTSRELFAGREGQQVTFLLLVSTLPV